MTKLLSAQKLNAFANIRKEEMMKLFGILAECSKKGEPMLMSTRCSGSLNESKKIKEIANGIRYLGAKIILGDMWSPFNKFDFFGYGRRLRGLYLQFDNLVEGIMAQHKEERQERQTEDVMDILLEICADEASVE
ncbi:hypothetical protein RJ639_015279 [Escallonia herrerae]|uniref:Uncharacterized protein n=1 Tax=Escallonia herrerae TaxID=1293975 RepID=A0AA88VGX2_9ASTE|nr:hypothetical protein RJ639_015279 [Escallonia herrerae]